MTSRASGHLVAHLLEADGVNSRLLGRFGEVWRVSESRSVVITGASRGLGLASAARLYRSGWTVVAAMRSVDSGLARLRQVTGAAATDSRLVGVRLDLTDATSVSEAACGIDHAVGAPYAVVHNAGITAAGMVEETPLSLWRTFSPRTSSVPSR
jgi:NAD(P)-dependent dehydrogenase (short-subunit alcohol dehydrogenase family)